MKALSLPYLASTAKDESLVCAVPENATSFIGGSGRPLDCFEPTQMDMAPRQRAFILVHDIHHS